MTEKIKPTKENASKLGKEYAFGAGIVLLVYTSDFISSTIELGAWAPIVAIALPTAFRKAKEWWTKYWGKDQPVDPPMA